MSASWPGLSEWEGFLTQLLVLTIASQMQVPIWSQEDCHLHLAKANLCKLSPELGAWITNRDSPIALKFKAQFQLYSQEVWGSFLCLRSYCKYLMIEEGWELCTHSCPLSLWSMTCSAASEPVTTSAHTGAWTQMVKYTLWAQFLQHCSTKEQCLVSTICVLLCPLMFVIIQVNFTLWK